MTYCLCGKYAAIRDSKAVIADEESEQAKKNPSSSQQILEGLCKHTQLFINNNLDELILFLFVCNFI